MKATSAVAQAVLDLGRNLVSGLRLAFAMPVSLLDFRVSVRQLLALAVLGMLLDALLDYVRAGPGSVLMLHAIVYEGFDMAVLLLTAALLGAAFRQPHLKLALPVVALAAQPVLGLFGLFLTLPGNQGELLGFSIYRLGERLSLAWLAFVLWRATAVALSPRAPRFWLRSLSGAALLMLSVPLVY